MVIPESAGVGFAAAYGNELFPVRRRRLGIAVVAPADWRAILTEPTGVGTTAANCHQMLALRRGRLTKTENVAAPAHGCAIVSQPTCVVFATADGRELFALRWGRLAEVERGIELAPTNGGTVITKRAGMAFTGTDRNESPFHHRHRHIVRAPIPATKSAIVTDATGSGGALRVSASFDSDKEAVLWRCVWSDLAPPQQTIEPPLRSAQS